MRMILEPKRRVSLACIVCALFLASAFLTRTSALLASRVGLQVKIKHVTASGDRQLWRVDLHSMGYPADNSQPQQRRSLEKFNAIDFVSESVVAATFLTRENVRDLQRRDDPNRTLPYKLHAIFLDAATGNELKTLEWPIDNPVAGIFPRFDGGFLFLSTDHVALYSENWTPVKDIPLPQLQGSPSPLRGISESPSGKTIVVQFRRGITTLCLKIQTATLDSSENPCEIPELFSASDEGVAAPRSLLGGGSGESRSSGPIVQYDVSMPGDSSDAHGRIQNPEKGSAAQMICNSCVGMPQFVNNDTIVVYTLMQLKVVGRNRNLKLTESLNPLEVWIDELGRPVRSSANGERFVVAFNVSQLRVDAPMDIRMSTGGMPAAFPDHIDAYDLTTEKWIYTLKIRGTHVQKILGLALSPSGEKLAIDSGGVIQAYVLPPRIQSTSPNH